MKEKNESDQEISKIISLEDPHNHVHLAVGGFYQEGLYNTNPEEYQQAQGGMGDNETASFDPIFFFHHAFIDYAFWVWQKHGLTKSGSLDVIPDHPGTYTDQSSPVGLAPGTMLDMETPLYPFRGKNKKWVTSNDVTNIHGLGYGYGMGSLDVFLKRDDAISVEKQQFKTLAETDEVDPAVNNDIAAMKHIQGINPAEIEGSFVIRTIASYRGVNVEVDRTAVLSRLNVRNCANCQTHLEAESIFPMYQGVVDELQAPSEDEIEYRVMIDDHSGMYEVDCGVSLLGETPVAGTAPFESSTLKLALIVASL